MTFDGKDPDAVGDPIRDSFSVPGHGAEARSLVAAAGAAAA
jgi:hypothetical protein